jgi:hypothetical protein
MVFLICICGWIPDRIEVGAIWAISHWPLTEITLPMINSVDFFKERNIILPFCVDVADPNPLAAAWGFFMVYDM